MLRADPSQRPRLEELIEALEDRKIEAAQRGWLGELEGIEISLNAAQEKLRQMARQVSLGMRLSPQPDIADESEALFGSEPFHTVLVATSEGISMMLLTVPC